MKCVGCRIGRIAVAFLLLLATSLGCARVTVHTEGLPPVLAQDEVLRPYEKVATIEVGRDRYGDPVDLTPDDVSWGYQTLRQEAARLKADAVIFPEVTVDSESYLFYPASHITAKGIAIKFK